MVNLESGRSLAGRTLRLYVVAESGPSVVPRVLGHFENLNLTPHRILAEGGQTGFVDIEIDVCGLAAQRLCLIAAKIGQNPCVIAVSWEFV